jgi:hypothetical protein
MNLKLSNMTASTTVKYSNLSLQKHNAENVALGYSFSYIPILIKYDNLSSSDSIVLHVVNQLVEVF